MAEAAQIRTRQARRCAIADRLRRVESVEIGRNALEQLFDRRDAAAVDLLACDDLNRQPGFGFAARNVRAGDDYLVERDGFGRPRRGCLRQRRQADRNQCSESADPRIDFSLRYVSPFRPQQANPR